MDIITGKTGSPHVTAQQDREINCAIFGDGNYVLSIGQKLAYELSSSNTVRIKDGMLVMQGCCASIAAGAYEDIIIPNSTQGSRRIDLICAKYEKDISTGNESVNLIVINGTPGSEPAEPNVPDGSIRDGAVSCYFPLYAVRLDGVTVQSVTAKFELIERNLHGTQKELWSGAYVMSGIHVVPLKELISEQPNGIILEFSPYTNETARNYCKRDFFIPKYIAETENGQSRTYQMSQSNFSVMCEKTLYIYNDKIVGVDGNASSGTVNGITYNNMGFVLRRVIGV